MGKITGRDDAGKITGRGEGGEGGEEKDGRRGFGDSEPGDLVGRAGEREIKRSPVIGAVGII